MKKLRRPNWLAELQSILLISLVLATAGLVFGLVSTVFDDSVRFTIPVSGVEGLTAVDGNLHDNAAIDGGGEVDVRVTDPSTRQRVLSLFTGAPSLALGVTLLALLWSTVRIARRGEPFSPTVVRRLSWLGVVALVGGPVVDLVQAAATFVASETVFDDTISASYVFSWWWLLAGFGFLATAEVIKRGVAMRVELDEVV
jgi:hypothetical protein